MIKRKPKNVLKENIIYCEDCIDTMSRIELSKSIDVILTSPPYNTGRIGRSDKYNTRYSHIDENKTDEEFISWILNVFNGYDNVLKNNGCVLFNISYSSEKTSLIWLLISDIIRKTNFITADCIVWKKQCALPNNRSKNKLTRIVEYIFVFCRKTELNTFNSNKKVSSIIEKTGQKSYENIYNLVEAKNNDGVSCNGATFSSELVIKLLNIYAKENSIIYDSFMGTGTTAIGCINSKRKYIGSEISEEYCQIAENRIKELKAKL